MKTLLILFAVAAVGQTAGSRFDLIVREDFFAGLAGDTARFERGMKRCEDALAKEPRNPDALVWHGGGLFFQSGQAFRSGDSAKMELDQRAMREMNLGVELAPNSLQTRIPRGAILIASAVHR